ncbi:MAG: hypothetical protein B7Z14_09690 [Bosea sp. 32-68-6]|nr:MAG: hypothetical protein B7Z14_09690 [Bosea sp. 32-68-6]
MARKGLRIGLDIRAACEAVAEEFAIFGEQALPRAAQFSINGVAMDAARRFRARVPVLIDRPTQKTLDGIVLYELDRAALSTIRSVDQVQASIKVGPLVSIWMKHFFGAGPQKREPGDVGLAQDAIWVPFWNNITVTQGVRPDRHGNVPQGFVGRIKREIKAGASGNGKDGQWRVWEGPFTVKGVTRQSIVAAPPRKKLRRRRGEEADFADGTREFIDNDGRRRVVPVVKPIRNAKDGAKSETPRVLFVEVDHAEYPNLLEAAWQESSAKAAESFGARLDKELDEKWRHKRPNQPRPERKVDQSTIPAFLRD